MKILKSQKEIEAKRSGGMDQEEEAASYQAYKKLSKNPSGMKPDSLAIEDMTGKTENYYCWVFWPEQANGKEDLPDHVKKLLEKANKKKLDKFHYEGQLQQERYEWFCGGWVQFYDMFVRPEELGGKEHKLFFYWNRMDEHGVAIYINDEMAASNYKIDMVYNKDSRTLIYTAPPPSVTTDPPTVPPPPPPSKS